MINNPLSHTIPIARFVYDYVSMTYDCGPPSRRPADRNDYDDYAEKNCDYLKLSRLDDYVVIFDSQMSCYVSFVVGRDSRVNVSFLYLCHCG